MVNSPSHQAATSAGMLAPPASWAEVEAASSNPASAAADALASKAAADAVRSPKSAAGREDGGGGGGGAPGKKGGGSGTKRPFHKSTSIELLARISAEIHDQQPREENNKNPNSKKDGGKGKDGGGADGDADGDDDKAGNNTSYRKLPPGVTPKNNRRLFVKHSYRDNSNEVPRSDELDLLGPNAPLRTPNAAFPLKLLETLRQIELDGLDDIVGK
jgi:hypothetical protein